MSVEIEIWKKQCRISYQEILKGVEDVAANSITLAVETADLVSFDRYLDSKIPATYTNNPWFSEFYEVS